MEKFMTTHNGIVIYESSVANNAYLSSIFI
jgi:hypothetical protein